MGTTNKLIFFDLDGTLLNTDDRWYQIHKDLAKVYGYIPMGKNEYLRAKKSNISEEILIQKTNIPKHFVRLYINKRIKIIESQKYLLLDTVRPGIRNVLAKIENKYRLILVTKRKKPQNCLNQLKKIHLIQFFSKILITKQEEKYTLIQSLLKTDEIKNGIFIGDTEDDFQTGEKLHLKTLLVSYGARDREFIQKLNPHCVVNSVKDLSRTIEMLFHRQ